MLRKYIFFLIIAVGFHLLIYGDTAVRGESAPNIILIGWDGVSRNRLKECLERGELLNLKNLSSEGALVAIDILRATDTKAGWAQILTGYEPEVTGVYSNRRYKPIPKGYTIFERVEEFFGRDNIVTVAVMGKKENIDNTPALSQPVKYRLIPAGPYYYMQQNMDIFINGLKENKRVGSRALELLEKYKDRHFFFFVQFAEADYNGHKFGEQSPEYNAGIKSADYWTGKIMRKLKELNLYEVTLIYVTADHGFDEQGTTHFDAPYVFLATNDPRIIRRGERKDIAPTILKRFGLDLNKIQPPLDGHSLTESYKEQLW